ncbi:MAG: cytidylate kinase-like family protein [Oscillospiraceae bacterium]|nr:cytidylate kinase-like family protein [Oscillospiraceae bacterium]
MGQFRIITVSREFGSGGRELGRRMASELDWDYYDGEIIAAIAKNSGMDPNYVESALEDHGWQTIPMTLQRTFASPIALQQPQVELLLEQRRVIEGVGKLGKNCIVVGRNADILLEEYHPFNLFVCADMQAKIDRCISRAKPEEDTSRKELEKRIRRVDKNRARTREILASTGWGQRGAYHLIVNTTGWDLEQLAPAVADFAIRWFETR